MRMFIILIVFSVFGGSYSLGMHGNETVLDMVEYGKKLCNSHKRVVDGVIYRQWLIRINVKKIICSGLSNKEIKLKLDNVINMTRDEAEKVCAIPHFSMVLLEFNRKLGIFKCGKPL